MKRIATAFITALLCVSGYSQSLTLAFDSGWKFLEQDAPDALSPDFDDSAWTAVDLPHDWDISHAPSLEAPMGNDGGYYPGGIGWYRKVFSGSDIALSNGHKLVLHFEGVYHRSSVFVNGKLAATHAYGYTPFRADITDLFNPDGVNVVAVKVDNSHQPNCRWYSGSGIYRHVWLEEYDSAAADDPLKLFVRTEEINGISADGTTAESAVVRISYEGLPDEIRTFENVKLWSPGTPVLYDITFGALTVKHGFRTVSFDAENGFLLNGQPTLVNGACVHHDNGAVGAMAFYAADIRKVRLMKQAGFNLIRTSHNLQSRAFMDACDSLGMMVIDEIFDGWYSLKTAGDHHVELDSCWREDIDAMVLRDRNHPSVICWSIGNEVIERKEIKVVQTASKFKARILENDTTRPVTEALCTWDSEWEIFDPHAAVLDVVGYNYLINKAFADHERCPERVIWQTESYPRDAFSNWDIVDRNNYIVGDIVWTGLDYLGESGIGQFYYDGEPDGEHYIGKHFPFHGAYCGDVDITGWRKPISHYRDILWNAEEGSGEMYMAVKEPDGYWGTGISETQWSVWPTWESWSWPGWEGKTLEVEVYTKAPAANLYLNGKLIGTQQVSRQTGYKAVFAVPYEAGVLRSAAVGPDGREIASGELRTAGKPVSVRLTPDKKVISADGQDLSYVVAELVDSKGVVVPCSDKTLSVGVSGAASLISVASADLKDLEPLTTPQVTTYKGRAVIVLRSTRKAGGAKLSVTGEGLRPATLRLTSK